MPKSKLLTIDGETKPIAEWARDAGFSALVIRDRLRMGWPVDRNLLTPKQAQHDHGQSRTPEFFAWSALKQRCYNSKEPSYRLYGGRGIRVCARWLDGEGGIGGFQCFLADMGPRPAGASVERVNVNGHYDPLNCVWASASAQARNRRSTRLIRHNDKTQCITDWAKELGLSQPLLHWRLTNGWPVEKAFTAARKWTRKASKGGIPSP